LRERTVGSEGARRETGRKLTHRKKNSGEGKKCLHERRKGKVLSHEFWVSECFVWDF
jgi:hypothetical protein